MPATPATGKPNGRGRGTGSALIYGRLREEILSLEQPPGARLDETGLGERFGLSRSPVREALIKLASDGLVVLLPNRGAQVAPFDVTGFPKYLDALDLMQRVTTRLAAAQRTAAQLDRIEQLRDAFERAAVVGDVMVMIEVNRNFHVAISEAARNPYFLGLSARLLDEGMRMQRLHYLNALDTTAYSNQEIGVVIAEHAAMAEAIAAQDLDRAEEIAHAHIEQFRAHFLDYLRENPSIALSLESIGERTTGEERKA